MHKKDYRNLIILTVIPLFLVLIVTHFTNVFGSDTDWINQHTIFPEYFRNMFYSTGKLLPNLALHYGAGQNIFNLSYYGLLSPIILLSYLFPFVKMSTYLTIVGILSVILSGYLFYYFLRKNHFSTSISITCSLLLILAEPFLFHMHRHIMFVNYMPFLIMGFIGIDELIHNNKKSLLIISTFLMIMTSYYYSVGGILVLGFYYLYQYFNANSSFTFKEFCINSLKAILPIIIAILMAGVLLLPTCYTLLNGRSSGGSSYSLVSLLQPNFNIYNIFCGTYAIGLSILAFISLLYLFFTKKKHNIILASLISIILFIPLFRFLLNGGLYLREKCFIPFIPLFSFFIAVMLNDLFEKKVNIKKFLLFVVIICGLLYFANQKDYCYIYLLGFVIFLLLYDKYRKEAIILGFLLVASFSICLVQNLKEDYVTVDDYNQFFASSVENTIGDINSDDQDIYRTNNLLYPTKTLNKIYNSSYLTTNLYASTYNSYYLEFLRHIININVLEYNYFMVSPSNNIIFNTLMGVKYLYSSYDPGIGYEEITDNLYMNNDVYPLFYADYSTINENDFDKIDYPYNMEVLLHNSVVSSDNKDISNQFNIQEYPLELELINNEGVLIEQNDDGYLLTVKDNGKLTLKLPDKLLNQLLFINLYGIEKPSSSNGNITITINNVSNLRTNRGWIYDNKNEVFHYVISSLELETLEVTLTKGTYQIDKIEMFVMDYDKVVDHLKELTPMENILYHDDTIIGDIVLSSDGYFITSLPYDEGFTVKVNGIEVDKEIVNKAFLGFKLSKGSYHIEISYKAPLLKEGYIVSGLGFSLLAFMIFLDYTNNKKRKLQKN